VALALLQLLLASGCCRITIRPHSKADLDVLAHWLLSNNDQATSKSYLHLLTMPSAILSCALTTHIKDSSASATSAR
jgi:hypothetical protein